MTEQHSRLPLDSGCELHPRCLECPRPRCQHDDPINDGRTMAATAMFKRNKKMRALRKGGVPVRELATRYSLERRQIGRILDKGGGRP